jgi:hypothetical protein
MINKLMMDDGFNFDIFRATLSGGAKHLAYRCKFVSIEERMLVLRTDPINKPLVAAFGKKLGEQIGLGSDFVLSIEIRRDQ